MIRLCENKDIYAIHQLPEVSGSQAKPSDSIAAELIKEKMK